MLQAIKYITRDFLHLIYPHICIGCGSDVLDDKEQICAWCFSQLPVTDYFQYANNTIEQKFAGRILVQHAASTYYFTKQSVLQRIMFELKYNGNKEAGIFLGVQTGKALLQSERFINIDVIVPMPLNKRRQQQRGYNQAAEIAKGIASVIGKPVMNDTAIRKMYTETQTHKNRTSRWQTMQQVFAIIDVDALQGKHVLLIDDIVTTGATLEACGEAILSVPDTALSIVTAAYTIL